MLAKVYSSAVIGLEGVLVEVEVDIAQGLPGFTIVGLGDTAVQESRERVRAAVRNCGGSFPMKRITVNLAPADLRKAGPAYDLPIAIGLLLASEQVQGDVQDAVFIGELGLDGAVRHIDGVLPMVAVAREQGIRRVFVPQEDAAEAALVTGISIIPVQRLDDLTAHLSRVKTLPEYLSAPIDAVPPPAYPVDFSVVRGQEHVKRTLEIAAAGGHHVLMTGSPGSGKTLMARALISILPPLTMSEAIEVTKIYSVAGQLPKDTPLIRQRPFCAPHHTTSLAGLVGGGGVRVKPGMISLAHRGILFLDELPEFGGKLDVLRQPLEDRVITLSRAVGSITYPASFMLIAAQNPCICGWHGDPERQCTCTAAAVARYQRRVSGPVIDRFDIFVYAPRVPFDKLNTLTPGEESAAIRERVIAARQIQERRFRGTRLLTNSDMGPAEIHQHCQLDSSGQLIMHNAMRQHDLSARGYHRILKLARTIADLAGSERITAQHLGEALQYRLQPVE